MAILAVLKSGAAYLPIDPAHPDARIEFMVADAAPVVAVSTAGLAERLAGSDVRVIDVADPRIDTQPSTRCLRRRPTTLRMSSTPRAPREPRRGWRSLTAM